MWGVKRWVCGWIMLALLWTGVAVAEDTYRFEAYMPQEVWDSVETRYCGFESPEDFERAARGYVAQIVDITGATDWHLRLQPNGEAVHVTFEMTSDVSHFTSSGQNGKAFIRLKETFFQLGLAPVGHELSHMVLGRSASLSLEEGACSYMQSLVSDTPDIHSAGVPVHVYAKTLLANSPTAHDISQTIGKMSTRTPYNVGKTRSPFYALSHSFVKYLVETYGIEKFMTLYNQGHTASYYAEVYGKPFETLRMEWFDCLDGQEALPEVPDQETFIRERIAGFVQGV